MMIYHMSCSIQGEEKFIPEGQEWRHGAGGSNTFSPLLEIENNLVKIVWTFTSDALNGEFKHGS